LVVDEEVQNERARALSKQVAEAFRCFAIAHEYAHCLLGHIGIYRYDNDSLYKKHFHEEKENLAEAGQGIKWEAELKADRLPNVMPNNLICLDAIAAYFEIKDSDEEHEDDDGGLDG